jgi:hypothetical protein
MTFNQLFLVYVAMLPLWSLVALLVGVDTDGLCARFSPKLPPCGLFELMSEGDLKYADITITELEYNVTGRQ